MSLCHINFFYNWAIRQRIWSVWYSVTPGSRVQGRCHHCAFIPISDHSYCFENVYLETSSLEHLVDIVAFLFKTIIISTLNTYAGIRIYILSILGSGGSWDRCLLLIYSSGTRYGMLLYVCNQYQNDRKKNANEVYFNIIHKNKTIFTSSHFDSRRSEIFDSTFKDMCFYFPKKIFSFSLLINVQPLKKYSN